VYPSFAEVFHPPGLRCGRAQLSPNPQALYSPFQGELLVSSSLGQTAALRLVKMQANERSEVSVSLPVGRHAARHVRAYSVVRGHRRASHSGVSSSSLTKPGRCAAALGCDASSSASIPRSCDTARSSLPALTPYVSPYSAPCTSTGRRRARGDGASAWTASKLLSYAPFTTAPGYVDCVQFAIHALVQSAPQPPHLFRQGFIRSRLCLSQRQILRVFRVKAEARCLSRLPARPPQRRPRRFQLSCVVRLSLARPPGLVHRDCRLIAESVSTFYRYKAPSVQRLARADRAAQSRSPK